MLKRCTHLSWVIIILILLTTGCSGMDMVSSETVTETVTPSPTATLTMTPTLTPTATSTPTLTPTLEGGGAGKIFFVSYFRTETGNVIPRMYTYEFASNLSQLIFEDYYFHDISPTGDEVLISEGTNLYLASLDGVEMTLLRSDLTGWAKWFAGSDDILFMKKIDGINQLVLLDTDGEIEQLTFSSIGVMDFDGVLFGESLLWEEGEITGSGAYSHGWRLTNPETNEITQFGYNKPSISSDGQYLAVAVGDEFTIFTKAIRIINTKDEVVVEVSFADLIDSSSPEVSYNFSGSEWVNNNEEFIFSLDGFSSTQSEAKHYIVSINDDSVREINTSLQLLAWSPDGTQFIGASHSNSDEDGGGWRLFKSDFFGNETELLMDQEIISNIRFFMSEMVWLP